MERIKEKISIIMPAYNEEEIIEKNLIETIDTFETFKSCFEIIVVDDGSSDATWQKIMNISARFPCVKAVRNLRNYGKGRALKKGFRFARGEYVVFLDSDIDLHPIQISTFFDIMEINNADVVIGSKRHPNSVVNYPLHRKILSNVYFFIIKLFFNLPIHDTQTGLKLFKYKVLKDVFPKVIVKAFAFDLELLLYAHKFGYRIAEAPVIINSQRPQSRIRLKDVFLIAKDTIFVFFRTLAFKN